MLTRERFRKDVANHVMEVFRDEGTHRHIRFRRPGTMCDHFDLITWPGYLCFTGDRGTYVFRRLEDMFTFFRLDEYYGNKPTPGGVLDRIDHRYWAEKLEASDKGEGHQEWDHEAFQQEIREQRRRIMREQGRTWTKADRKEMWRELDELIDTAAEGETVAVAAVLDWYFQPRYRPVDSETERAYIDTSDFPRCKKYTHRFLWCCYALRWGIDQYDKSKEIEV